MRSIAVLSLAGLLVMGTSAAAGSSTPAEPGLAANTCSACHGDDGISSLAWFPNLAGQTQSYLEAQLKNFKDHSRADHYAKAYMWSIAGPLSDKQVTSLATYYAALPPAKGASGGDPAEIAAGKAIFANGINSENVPACGICHGPGAGGTEMAPRLAGQRRDYLMAQLKAFRSNARNNPIMNSNVQHMTDAQMRDIAAYLASL